jgi:hypothetical protein
MYDELRGVAIHSFHRNEKRQRAIGRCVLVASLGLNLFWLLLFLS